MSIERLHTAAKAAGYAMATAEDEIIAAAPVPDAPPASRALALVTKPVAGTSVRDSFGTAATWLRGYMPTFGGRAPA